MKKLILITLMNIIWGTCYGAIITTYTDQSEFVAVTGAVEIAPEVTGDAVPIPGGFFFTLWNLPGHALDRTVTLNFAGPVNAFGATWDNLPYGVGTGIELWTGGAQVAEFGAGVLIQGFYGIVSDVSFTSLRLKTNAAFGSFMLERGTATGLLGTPQGDSAVPEPGTWLVGVALAGLAWLRRK